MLLERIPSSLYQMDTDPYFNDDVEWLNININIWGPIINQIKLVDYHTFSPVAMEKHNADYMSDKSIEPNSLIHVTKQRWIITCSALLFL